MLRSLTALLAGAIFGVGLAVSGMMNPAKVLGFLDVAGDWDPTLAFVMGGALLVTVPAFRGILKRPRPVLNSGFDLPAKSTLDGRLLGGSAIFGVGWGLSGFCPGPAVAAFLPALWSGFVPVLAFVGAMVAGMALHHVAFGRPDVTRDETPPSPSATARR